jgi:D-sedoheptulose 7-phosphate isomerase
MSAPDLLRERIDEVIAMFAVLREDEAVMAAVEQSIQAVVSALRGRGRVLLCGNGGSSADAQHIAAEFVGRFILDREPLAAIALSDNVAAITAVGNDYGYEETFARAVKAHGREGDVLFALSTSGRSTNVVAAVHAAREGGITTVAFVGPGESPVALAADVVVKVEASSTARIQEGHKFLGHTIVEAAERELCA